MAHSGLSVSSDGRLDPALVGAVLTRLGLAVLALGAMDGPLLAGFGLLWLFHVSTLTLLCGCWLLGAGLFLSGLYG